MLQRREISTSLLMLAIYSEPLVPVGLWPKEFQTIFMNVGAWVPLTNLSHLEARPEKQQAESDARAYIPSIAS